MKIEQSLKDSEIRYRRLFEATQDGILILDAETGMIEDVNPYLIKMLGYSREEFVKKKLWEVGAFKDIEASKDAFEVLQDSEYIRYEDLPLKTKDGRLIQVEFVSNVYLVGNEKVIQCNIRDITEHRRIIAALQGNEKKYHDLINQSPDGYFIIELSGNILTANKAMCKQLEFSEEEFLSLHIWDIVPEQYLDQYRERLTKVLNGESFKEAAEYEVRGKSGKTHYVEVLSAPRYSGKDVIGFQGIARDITARKRAENALQESEARNRRLVEHLPTVVYMNAVGDTSSTLYVSPQIEALLGYTPQEWLADPKLWSKTLHPEDRQHVLKQAAHTDQSNKPFEMEYRMIARDGRVVWVHDQIVLVNASDGKPQFWQGIMLDITERKRSEDELYESEERFKNAFQYSAIGMALVSLEGKLLKVNPLFCSIIGYSEDELLTKTFQDITHPDDLKRDLDYLNQLLAGEISSYTMEKRYFHKEGRIIWVLLAVALARDHAGAPLYFISQIKDITESKHAGEALRESEERFRAWIENSLDVVTVVGLDGIIQYGSPSYEHLLGYKPEEIIGTNAFDFMHPDDRDRIMEIFAQNIQEPESVASAEFRLRHRDGSWRVFEGVGSTYLDKHGQMVGLINSRDITERKQGEEALRASESKFRSYIENAPLSVFIADRSGRYVEANTAATSMLGYTESELLQLSIPDVLAPQSFEAGVQQFQKVVQDGSASGEFLFRRKDGTQFWVTVLAVRLSEDRFMSYCQDITERKQAGETLREKQRLLSEAQRIGHIGSWSYDILTDTLQYSDEMHRLLDTSPQEFQHNMAGLASLVYASDRPVLTKWVEEIRAGRQVKELDFRFFRKTGELCYLQTRGAVIFDSAGKPVRFIGMAQDVSERKLAEIQIRQQIQRLTALSKIDQAIISTSTLSIKMKTILSQLVVQLQVDAADILLLNDDSQLLEYLAGSGFRTQAYENARVPVGRSLAGRVVTERRLLKIENIKDQPDDPLVSAFLAKEEFVSYYAVPLITNGKVKGVLEVFHRAALHPYAEWLDYLNLLAGQAVIAIENSSLVTNLEQSNRELSQAYDATIEGWSRALDLRDKETEGHSQRVTQITVKLAGTFGLSEAELVQVRWGSLLHDIGKMGVPDGILLKPGPLTDEEWVAMKKHPMFAYEMLVPIRYLKLALDIPYCHHEKWDGTGYPRGLKGEQIPLSARIFAVVDVWDALSSDRTYRPRWPVEKVREHIHALSGTHFDPQVVTRFLQVVE